MYRLVSDLCIFTVFHRHQRFPNVLSNYFSKSLDLDSQFLKDCEYIDLLTSRESQSNLFPNQLKLLPPDIVKQIEHSRKEKGLTEKDK